MKKSLACLLACSGLFLSFSLSAQLSENGSRISILNGYNSFTNSSSKDSIYFLKGGLNLGVQGNYYWKSLGIAGRIGYFTNNASEGKLADFGLSRKAVPDRTLIASKPYKGYYWMAGPSFQTTFSRWQVESTVLGGLFHHDDAGVYIGDRISPDIVYYRNKIEAGSAFAWNVGFGLNYAISSLVGLGISADYMSTQSDVMNTDINRNGGTQQQSLTEQANFLSTALKLTYSLNGGRSGNRTSAVQNKHSKPSKSYFETGDKPTATQKTTDCDCDNKVTDVAYLEPLTIDISFTSLEEAQNFLKTTSPLYEDKGLHGTNPLYNKREAGSGMATGRRQYKPIVASYDEGTNTFEVNGKYYAITTREAGSGMATGKRSSIAIDESGVHRGMMVRSSNGERVFALLPATINLEQLSYLDGSNISVHVQNQNQLKAQNNNTVRSNRTDNALIDNKDDQHGNDGANVLKAQNNNTVRSNRTDNALFDENDGLLDIVLYTDAAGKTSARIFRNTLKNFFEQGDRPTGEQYTTRETGSGMATGRRMHKPMTVMFDEENGVIDVNGTYYQEIITAREAGSGMATGRTKTSFAVLFGGTDSAQSQRLLPTVNKKSIPIRIIAGDEMTAKAILTNNPHRGGSATLNSQSSSTRQTQGASFGERVRNGVAAGGAALVAGDPIPGLDVILKRRSDGMIVNTVTDENGLVAAATIEEGEYEIQAINNEKWNNAPIAIKIAEKILMNADTDGDGKTETFTSRPVSDKPLTHVHGDPHVDQKETWRSSTEGGTMEYRINTIQPLRCENGTCTMTCAIIINGKEYSASVSSVLKTKHDTVKNSVNNIR